MASERFLKFLSAALQTKIYNLQVLANIAN